MSAILPRHRFVVGAALLMLVAAMVGLTRLYSTHDKRALSVPIGFVMSVQQRLREQGK